MTVPRGNACSTFHYNSLFIFDVWLLPDAWLPCTLTSLYCTLTLWFENLTLTTGVDPEMLIFQKLFNHSIGKKAVVAATGVGLALFLLSHMGANLLIFAGPDAINSYAQGLRDFGKFGDFPAFLWTARLGLIGIFVVHVVLAIQLTRQNSAARPTKYKNPNTVQASFASRYMILTGMLVLLFLLLHLAHFTLGYIEPKSFAAMEQITKHGAFVKRHDVYTMVITDFRNPVFSGLYLLSMLVLALHLHHGVGSLFQSLGFVREGAYGLVKKISVGAMALLVVGFSAVPVAVLLNLVKLTGE